MKDVTLAGNRIVGRERNQRASYRQLVRNDVDRRRVNSTVGALTGRSSNGALH